ncbi:CidA/LrgA family protein [Stappia taiwanensis]|uniref:CidA/LrgA family protein n=1 Tax=Stappia taiwanensis TaxID=992267 RepID=A0A838XND9_9HYPH|nr:CidA/LrgA family protein [Stappia taiwanensis]MBA4610531.1 CidA/LrgA family protein [Stappia taiwanensis]GGE84142.1 hypothetical protein GCM10007285_09710 [Stappia taiwanensis]
MLGALTVILCCQLAGEMLVAGTGLPVPGPVVGMVLLFVGLVLRRGIPVALARVGDTLLGHLALLFVPAGVGVVLHIGLLGREGAALSVSLLISTLLTIAVTAGIMRLCLRGGAGDGGVGKGKAPEAGQ